jgi:hypothetical protein
MGIEMTYSNFEFMEALLCRVPELMPLYEEHLRDNPTLLPHLLMGEITRFAAGIDGPALTRESTRALLDFLEIGLTDGSDEVKNLVGVSFAENLIGEESGLARLKPMMGSVLRMEVDRFCG